MVHLLLKKPGNHVNFREAEKMLTKSEKFTELVFLYGLHGYHTKGKTACSLSCLSLLFKNVYSTI